MRYAFIKILIFLFVLTVGLIIADRYFFDRKINNFGTEIIRRPASYVFAKLENAGFFFRSLINFKNIISENDNLKRENLSLLSQLADRNDLKSENEFLRKLLELPPRFNKNITYANIYQFQIGLDGYDVLINKGADDGITDGDIVVTEEGVLVGRIESVGLHFARVLVVSDTDFSVAAEVLNSETAGIARGALAQGLYFDLIVQDDPIKEGDIIVSSGMDLVPPALVVGTVSYVETRGTNVFKKVKISPAMGEVRIGRVLIIRKGDGN